MSGVGRGSTSTTRPMHSSSQSLRPGASPLFQLNAIGKGNGLGREEETKDHDDGSEVKSLVERALKAWNEEFKVFVKTHVGAVQPVRPTAPLHLPISSPLSTPPSIQPSASLLVKLPALLMKLKEQKVVSRSNYLLQVLKSAERLKRVEQNAAAKVCFENYISVASESNDGTATSLDGAALANHVQVLYGRNECAFRLVVAEDETLKEPASVQRVQAILKVMQSAMELLFNDRADERLSYLLYNGALLVWQMVEPLIAFGYRLEALEYLNWILLSLESMAVLCSVRYLSFRVKIYLAIVQIQEWNQDSAQALAVAQRCLQKVREVASWESVSQPVPARTLFLLQRNAAIASGAVLKHAWLLGHVPDAELESKLSEVSGGQHDQTTFLTLLSLAHDPHVRTLDALVRYIQADKDFRVQHEQLQARKKAQEEQAAVQQAAEHAASVAAGLAAEGTKAKKAGSSSSKKNATGGGASAAADLLAEFQAASGESSTTASLTAGESTSRGGGGGGSGSARAGSASNGGSTKKKPRKDAVGEEDTKVDAPVRKDIRDTRVSVLVNMAWKSLRGMLAKPTPLAVLEAHALGFDQPRDLISASGMQKGLDETQDVSSAAAPSAAANTKPSVMHEHPGDWVSLRNIFQLAVAAFSAGEFDTFTEALATFREHAGLVGGVQETTPLKVHELSLDRLQHPATSSSNAAPPVAQGMEVQLRMLELLLALANGRQISGTGAREEVAFAGFRAQEVEQVFEFLHACATATTTTGAQQQQQQAKDATQQLSPSNTTSPFSPASPSSSSYTNTSFPASTILLALSKSPDLFSDAFRLVWKELLEPSLTQRRIESLQPPTLVPLAQQEDELARRARERDVGLMRCTDPEALGLIVQGLGALGTLLRYRSAETDKLWTLHVSLEFLQAVKALDRVTGGASSSNNHDDARSTTNRSSVGSNSTLGGASTSFSAVQNLSAGTLKHIIAHAESTVRFLEAHLGAVQVSLALRAVGGTLHSVRTQFNAFLGQVYGAPGIRESQAGSKPLASAFSRADTTLSCGLAEMLFELYSAKLSLGLQKAVSAARAQHQKVLSDLESKYALTASYRKAPPPLLLPSYNAQTESLLLESAGANLYKKVLILLAMLPFRPTHQQQAEFYEKRVKAALQECFVEQEESLLDYTHLRVKNTKENISAAEYEFDSVFPTPTDPTAVERSASGMIVVDRKALRGKLPPPRFVGRDSTTLVLRPVVPVAWRRANKPRSVILYGKASETGIDVSLNNNTVYPLGVEFTLPSAEDDADAEECPDIVVRGLQPNTSYVFACACLDQQGDVLHSIGVSTPRFVTCLPLSKPVLEGLICTTLRALGDHERLVKDAVSAQALTADPERSAEAQQEQQDEEEFQDRSSLAHPSFYFASAIKQCAWNVLAPFLRIRACASHTRQHGGAGSAATLGDGDRLSFQHVDEDSDEELEGALVRGRRGEKKSDAQASLTAAAKSAAITPYANRSDTNGVHDSYVLGPVPREQEFRLDAWQLHVSVLQDAPRPLLYLVAKVAHSHADVVGTRPPASKTIAAVQLQVLEVARSLQIALQASLALEDWPGVSQTVQKLHNSLLPVLNSGLVPLAHDTLLLQPLSTAFQACMLLRSAAAAAATSDVSSTNTGEHDPTRLTPGFLRACARLTFALLQILDARHEDSLFEHVLKQYVSAQQLLYAAAKSRYDSALHTWHARVALIAQAKWRAVQMREALDADAAELRARKEKDALSASKKKGSGSASAKKKSASDSTGAETPGSTARSVVASPRVPGEDEKEDGSGLAFPSNTGNESFESSPAVQSILAHPLLTATPGHQPQPTDYVHVMPEDQALANWLLSLQSHTAAGLAGEKLVAALLGRPQLLNTLTPEELAAQAAERKKQARKSGAKGSGEGLDPAPGAGSKGDAAASGGADDLPKDLDAEFYSLVRKASSAGTLNAWESCWTSMQPWKSHERFVELTARLVRAILEQGEVSFAKTVLAQAEDPQLSDERLNTSEDDATLAALTATAASPSTSPASPESLPAVAPSNSPSRPSSSGGGGESSRPAADDASHVAAPATPSKAASKASAQKKGRKGAAAEDAPPPAPVKRAKWTLAQIRWLGELELLRALVVNIDLESLRLSERLSNPGQEDDASIHTSLGWEFDASRASKLRPACMGVSAPATTSRRPALSNEASAGLPPIAGLKFPPLAGGGALSPRSMALGGGASGSLSSRSKSGALGSARGAGGALSPRALLATLGEKPGATSTGTSKRRPGASIEPPAPILLEPKPDAATLEFERFRRLGRAGWFAHRSESKGQLLSLVQVALNFLLAGGKDGRKYTPADLALFVHLHEPSIRRARERAAGLESPRAQPSAGAGATTSTTDPSGLVLTNVQSAAPTLPLDPSRSDAQFASPVTVLQTLSHQVLDLLDLLGHTNAPVYDGAPESIDRAVQWSLFADVPCIAQAQRSSEQVKKTKYWFLSRAGLPVLAVTKFLAHTVATLFHSLQWSSCLAVASRVHSVFHGCFSSELMKYVVYSREELRHRSKSALEAKKQELAELQATYEHDQGVIIARREARRSQRGKREEEERLRLLTELYHTQQQPLLAIEASLNAEFQQQDSALESLRHEVAHLQATEAKYLRPLINARFKLLSYYNESVKNGGRPGGVNGLAGGLAGGLDDLTTVGENHALSRPISRAGSIFDEAGGDADSNAAPTESDDVRSMISLSSIGSTILTSGPHAASAANTKKIRKIRERNIAQVIKAYQKAISALRSETGKEVGPLLGRVLHELADFAFVEYGVNAQHQKRDEVSQNLWLECLDASFGVLETYKQRAVLLKPYVTASGVISTSDSLFNKLGFWQLVNALLASAKLARLTYFQDMNLRMELVQFGSVLAKNMFHGSLTHPLRACDYASYQCDSLLAGVDGELYTDPTRVRMGAMLDALEFVGTNLLKWANDPVAALPVFTLYGYFARVVVRSVFHATNARILKARACISAGFLSEASLIYIQLLEGLSLPTSSVTGLSHKTIPGETPVVQAPVQPEQGKRKKRVEKTAEGGDVTGEKNDSGSTKSDPSSTGEVPAKANIPPFHAHLPASHSANRPFVSYLLGELAGSAQAHSNRSPLATLYGGLLWTELRFLRAEFLTRLARERNQVVQDLQDPDEGLATLNRPAQQVQKGKPKQASSRPQSTEGRPGSAERDSGAKKGTKGGVEDTTVSATSTMPTQAEHLALRASWLKAAERIYTETVALFVPLDPNAVKGETIAVPAPITSPSGGGAGAGSSKRAGRRGGQVDEAPAPVSRRRTAQGFAELFARANVLAGSVAPATAQVSVSLNTAPLPTAEANVSSHANLELLRALTHGHAINPCSLVAQSYDRLGELKAMQGLHSDAAYFRSRALRILSENAGSEITSSSSTGNTSGATTPSLTARTDRPSSPSLTARGMGARKGSLSKLDSNVKEGSFAALQRDRTDKLVKEFSAAASSGSDGLGSPRKLAPVSGAPTLGPFGLLSVPPAAGSMPLTWRQIPDAREWISLRISLAETLREQGRYSKAVEQLVVAEGEAQKMQDLQLGHRVAHAHARLLLEEGSFLAGFAKLRAAIWREPTHAEQAARALRLSKTPGGEKALPLPKAATYTLDHGAALLTLVHLLRRLPKKDALDMEGAKGDVYTAWILEMLETHVLDALEKSGVKPSDLALVSSIGTDEHVRKLVATTSALPHASREHQNLVDLHVPGVVSKFLPWVPTAVEAMCLRASDLLARGRSKEAMKRALLAEQLLSLLPAPVPAANEEVQLLICQIAWAKLRATWDVEGHVDLTAGMTEQEIFPPSSSTATRPVTPIPAEKGSAKKSSRAASPSTSSGVAPRASSPGQAGGDDGSSSAKKKPSSRKADELAAAQAAQAKADADAREAQRLAELSRNGLKDDTWELALGHLPRALKTREPRTLQSLFTRLHAAIRSNLSHGLGHMRCKMLIGLLVEVHSFCAAHGVDSSSSDVLPIQTRQFHHVLQAFWTLFAARVVQGFQNLRNKADDLGTLQSIMPSDGSSAVATSSTSFVPPPYLVATLTEGHKLRALRRAQELAFLTGAQSDAATVKEREDLQLQSASAAGGGKEARKEKEKDRARDKDGSSSAAGNPADEPVTTRALVLYSAALRAELSARRFESPLSAAFSPSQVALSDIHASLRAGVEGYSSAVDTDWSGAVVDVSASTSLGSSGLVAALHSATQGLDDLLPAATTAALWIKHARDQASFSTDVQSKDQLLTLHLTLSTDLHRGVAPAVEPLTAKGKKKPAASSSAATNASSSGSTGSRKKKPSQAFEEIDRTAAQQLFGPRAARFENVQIKVKKAEVLKLAASAASLRHTLSSRGSSDLLPSDKLSFVELLLALQSSLGSLRGSSIPGVAEDVKPSIPTLQTYLDFYASEYGLAPSLAEVQALESLLDCSKENGGAALATSNGVTFFLMQFEHSAVAKLDETTAANLAAQAAAAALAAAQPEVTNKKGSRTPVSTRPRTPQAPVPMSPL